MEQFHLPELSTLNKLERSIISKRMLFRKVRIAPEGHSAKVKSVTCNIAIDADDYQEVFPVISTPVIRDNDLNLRIQSLNKKQRDTFELVHKWARESVKKKSSKCPIKIYPLHLFITGKGGCGKSHLLKTIYHSLTKTLSYHVV